MSRPAPAGVFEALGDPVRRRILLLVAPGELTAGSIVTELQKQVSISQPGVSQHLGVLRACGLVEVRTEGARRWYRLSEAGVAEAQAWLGSLVAEADPLAPFAQPLDALATEVRRGQRAARTRPARPEVERGA